MSLLAAFAALGLAAGFLGAVLGMGGGLFIVPAITALFGLPLRTAVGASLLGIIATSVGVACTARPGRAADLSLAMRLELATTIGAIAGSLLAGVIPPRLLYGVFALVVLATAAYTAFKSRIISSADPDGPRAIDHWPAGLAASAVAGTLSGLTGVGGGFLKVPVMFAVMHVPFATATATSSFMVGITAATSASIYLARGDVHPLVAAPLCLGAILGAAIGGSVAHRIPTAPLRRSFVALLVAIAVEMMWKAFQGAT